MSIRSAVIVMTLNLGFAALPMVQHAALASSEPTVTPTPEQTQWVKDSVQQLRIAGLPAPLDSAPTELTGRTQILVSDAVSVMELAHVDFNTGTYYLSVRNPWTNVIQWYGEFALLQ